MVKRFELGYTEHFGPGLLVNDRGTYTHYSEVEARDDRIAELEAKNKRLTKERERDLDLISDALGRLSWYNDRDERRTPGDMAAFLSSRVRAERAEALSRTGAVKVGYGALIQVLLDLQHEGLCRDRDVEPIADRILSALEPAAPEGQQDPVAWMNSDHLEDYRQGNLDGGIAWAWREQTDFYDTPLYETPQPAPSAEPGFEIAPDNGIQEQVIAYILDCARRWVPEARIIGNARAGDIVRALSSQPVTEPFGYYCECKGADPAFLRKPAYIPPTDDLHTTTPLYTRPSEQAVTEAQVAAANGAFIDAFINGGSVFEGAEISGVNFDVCMRAALKAAMEA